MVWLVIRMRDAGKCDVKVNPEGLCQSVSSSFLTIVLWTLKGSNRSRDNTLDLYVRRGSGSVAEQCCCKSPAVPLKKGS